MKKKKNIFLPFDLPSTKFQLFTWHLSENKLIEKRVCSLITEFILSLFLNKYYNSVLQFNPRLHLLDWPSYTMVSKASFSGRSKQICNHFPSRQFKLFQYRFACLSQRSSDYFERYFSESMNENESRTTRMHLPTRFLTNGCDGDLS